MIGFDLKEKNLELSMGVFALYIRTRILNSGWLIKQRLKVFYIFLCSFCDKLILLFKWCSHFTFSLFWYFNNPTNLFKFINLISVFYHFLVAFSKVCFDIQSANRASSVLFQPFFSTLSMQDMFTWQLFDNLAYIMFELPSLKLSKQTVHFWFDFFILKWVIIFLHFLSYPFCSLSVLVFWVAG